jgi:alkylated DNA repair dioxygenase AlkB
MINGLTYQENFLTAEEQIAVLTEIDSRPWRDDLKRRVQHYGYIYDYKKRAVDPSMYLGPLPDFALAIAKKINQSKTPDQLIVNEYLPGQGIAAHIDCVPCFEDTISTISLGWAYEMDFINWRTKEKRSIMLSVGSIAVITGEARYDWTHQIKARGSDHGIPRQRRVSLTFRNVII